MKVMVRIDLCLEVSSPIPDGLVDKVAAKVEHLLDVGIPQDEIVIHLRADGIKAESSSAVCSLVTVAP